MGPLPIGTHISIDMQGDNVTVGLQLKKLRKSRRLTQAQVASGVNCSTATYSRYENGTRQPSIEMLTRLAEYFGVSMDYLFGKAPPTESALSEYEKELIRAVRTAPTEVQDDILDFLNLKMSKREALKR